MPVPRRFDRRPPERDTTRINERIRVPEVRLIGEDGQQVGILKTPDAVIYAQERDLDLVEVAPEARPPVCRVLDYSKYKYELAQKQKAARKHQQQITIREIKFRPKIAQHDYDTKKGHVTRFLLHKDKVKITIMFRGREVTHPERGVMLLERLAEELAELAIVEQRPIQDGRNMTMMLGPSKAVLADELPVQKPAGEATPDAVAEDGAVIAAPESAVAAAPEAATESAAPEAAPAEPAAEAEVPAAEPPAEAEAAAEPAANAEAPAAEPEAAAEAEETPAAEPEIAAAEPEAAAEQPEMPAAEAEAPEAEPEAKKKPAAKAKVAPKTAKKAAPKAKAAAVPKDDAPAADAAEGDAEKPKAPAKRAAAR